MDDWGVPLFSETSKWIQQTVIFQHEFYSPKKKGDDPTRLWVELVVFCHPIFQNISAQSSNWINFPRIKIPNIFGNLYQKTHGDLYLLILTDDSSRDV